MVPRKFAASQWSYGDLGQRGQQSHMTFFVRLAIAIVSGLSGLAAIFFVLRPGSIASQPAWLLGSVTLLVATTLFSSIGSLLQAREPRAEPAPGPPSSVEREVHSEVAKIISLLGSQVEANASFNAALVKANEQLPDSLKPDQVRMVISYLMIENENMRKRSADLQGNLEKSQRQIESLKSNLAVAEAQGLSDPLTSLKNRRGFDLTLAAEIAAARSGGKPMSLVMADIDHFKSINDRYGHPAGDSCLRGVGRVLAQQIVRAGDLAARYGGEE